MDSNHRPELTGDVTARDNPIDEADLQARGVRRPCLVILNGPHGGQTFRLNAARVRIGRSPEADIVLQDNGISRIHAVVERVDGKLVLRDMDSTNGTWVGEEQIRAHVLEEGDRVRLGSRIVGRFDYLDPFEEAMQMQLYEGAVRDALTGVFNRKLWFEELRREFSFATRHGKGFSIVLMDVDHFKQVNDRFGHPAGDAVLMGVAQRAAAHVRKEDVFARYGGEEFAILLRGAESVDPARFAERVRTAIASQPFMLPSSPTVSMSETLGQAQMLQVTISLGVSLFKPGVTRTVEELIMQADEALYRAKSGGRNRVCG